MNKLYVINMKMNLNFDEIEEYLKKINNKRLDNVIFCPTSIYIPYFIKQKLNVGIQNISEFDNGSYTGQISSKQASNIGVKYVILGHSEIVKYLKEDQLSINKKIKQCIKNNIIPILCIGELNKDDDIQKTIDHQLSLYLENINVDKIIIAYEPAFLIGSDDNINVNRLKNIVKYIKKVTKKYKINDIIILYGGNVNKNNIKNISTIEHLDGFLIGKSALNVENFLDMIEVT